MRCVTISYGKVKGNATKYRYVQPALYELVINNMVYKWKYVEHLGIARRSDSLAEEDAHIYADRMKIPFLTNVRNHNTLTRKQYDILTSPPFNYNLCRIPAG